MAGEGVKVYKTRRWCVGLQTEYQIRYDRVYWFLLCGWWAIRGPQTTGPHSSYEQRRYVWPERV